MGGLFPRVWASSSVRRGNGTDLGVIVSVEATDVDDASPADMANELE